MKSKFTLLICFTFLFASHALGQTPVSGGIFDSTIWLASGSPYLVTGQLVVFPGASLTIEPGTEVRFAANQGLELRSGSLYANGTSEDPILFTLDATDPDNSPKWLGIESTTPLGTMINIELSHIEVEYAQVGITYNGGAYRYVDHAIFRENDIAIYDGGNGYDWVTISNATFQNNTVGTKGRISVFDCTFTGHDIACADLYSFANGTEGARVVNCYFFNNATCIRNQDNPLVSAYISHSTFEDNDIVATAYRVNADSSSFIGSTDYAVYAGTGTIENSLFSDNTIGLRITNNPYQDTVRNNQFVNNDIGIQIEGAGAIVKGNSVCFNTNYGVYLSTSQNVDITGNCWCTTDPIAIAGMVFDAFDDVASGIASFEPFTTSCLGSLFYPGDANNDGLANNVDLLPIGLYFGQIGPAQDNPNNNWVGQEVEDWGTQMVNGLDIKHADANGNGTIDEPDVTLISDNYNSTHVNAALLSPVVDTEHTYTLSIIAPDIIEPQSNVELELVMSDESNPVESFYGTAFSIQADELFFEPGSFYINLEGSWMGDEQDLLTIYKEFPQENRIEIAITRKDGLPVTGNGLIAKLGFVMSEDLIVASETVENASAIDLILRLEEVVVVNHQGILLDIDYQAVALVVSDIKNLAQEGIRIFPNPVKNQLIIESNGIDINRINLFDATGKQVAEFLELQRNIGLEGFPRGIYLLQIMTPQGYLNQKIILE